MVRGVIIDIIFDVGGGRWRRVEERLVEWVGECKCFVLICVDVGGLELGIFFRSGLSGGINIEVVGGMGGWLCVGM